MQALLRQLQIHPIIPSVRSPEAVCRASETPAAAIFLLGGSILNKPVIAGGLISETEEIRLAQQAGATAVSVGDERLWSVQL